LLQVSVNALTQHHSKTLKKTEAANSMFDTAKRLPFKFCTGGLWNTGLDDKLLSTIAAINSVIVGSSDVFRMRLKTKKAMKQSA